MGKLANERTCEQVEGSEDESRRDALKRFGRYAAAAPTAMLLLEPHQAHAAPKKSKGRGGGKGRGEERAAGDTTERPRLIVAIVALDASS